MLNEAIGNVGNAFLNNRRMAQDEREREMDREMRERMLQEQMTSRRETLAEQTASRKDAAAARNQPSFTWTSGGVKMNASSMEDFSRLVQAHPADDGEDGSTIDLTGANEHGVQVHQKLKIPKNLPKTPETQQSVAAAIKSFAEMTGAQAKPKQPFQTAPIANAAKLGELQDALAEAKQSGDATALARAQRALENFQKMVDRPEPEFDSVTETHEAVAAKPAVEAKPGKSHWFLPDEPAEPGKPAEPARPAFSVTRKVPRGTPADAVFDATAKAPPPDELVTVINPQGKTVRIRKTQLQDAIAQGYKAQAQ